MNFLIRRYEDSDRDVVRELHVLALQAAGAAYQSGRWDEDLDHIPYVYLNRGEFLVGIESRRLIAMGAFKHISVDIAEIKRMRVHPEFQRQGYGQLILDALEDRAQDMRYRLLQLDTTIKQGAAQKLYEKNGYLEIRRETQGWPLETIFYRKELPARPLQNGVRKDFPPTNL